MAEGTLAYITPVSGNVPGMPLPEPPDNVIWPPPSLPPLPPDISLPPGIWPPAEPPTIGGGPVIPDSPIVIPQPPDKPIPGPPAVIWPPLPPGTGIAGKALILVWVVGVGYRWLVVGGTDIWPPPSSPDTPTPK